MNEYTNFAVMSYSFHGLKNIGAMDISGIWRASVTATA